MESILAGNFITDPRPEPSSSKDGEAKPAAKDYFGDVVGVPAVNKQTHVLADVSSSNSDESGDIDLSGESASKDDADKISTEVRSPCFRFLSPKMVE